jgi:hypothetical protein
MCSCVFECVLNVIDGCYIIILCEVVFVWFCGFCFDFNDFSLCFYFGVGFLRLNSVFLIVFSVNCDGVCGCFLFVFCDFCFDCVLSDFRLDICWMSLLFFCVRLFVFGFLILVLI